MSSSDHDESQRMLRQAALLGEQNLNRLDKWRLCNARAEEERASKRRTEDRKREREQEREHSEVEALRTELRQAVADLHSELERRDAVTVEAVGTAIGEHGNKVIDRAEQFVKGIQREFLTLVEKRFAEMAAKFEAVLLDVRSRASKEFKFAAEERAGDDKPLDLPDWRKVN